MSPAPSFRALVVSAHPDDIEFGCAGTLAQWVDKGAEVTYCIATDGSTGTQDRALVGERLAEVRRVESERAAKVIGAKEVLWLGYRDGYVEYTLDLRRDIARVFRRYRPHRFVVMDVRPMVESRFINHPDHRAVGQASLDIVMSAGTTPGHFPELLEEGLEPWRGLREVWVTGPGEKPVGIDISSTVDRKIEALMCHESQIGENAEEVAAWVRRWTAERGEAFGYAHAETFQVISQGPGFHADEQTDDADIDLARSPVHPPAAPTRRPERDS